MKYKDQGAIQKATEEGIEYVEEVVQEGASGKYESLAFSWNPRPEISFSHAVEDGSDDTLNAMVEQIWAKYDLDGDEKLNFIEAKPYIKNYCTDEMEMENTGNELIEETWNEIDENSNGFVTKEDMLNFLKRVWDEKN